MFLPVLMIGGKCSCFRAKPAHFSGHLPLPRATCEIQGYVYDAKMRSARLARTFWNDPELANRLEKEAAELKRRFNQDFWLADREFFALAIDGDGLLCAT